MTKENNGKTTVQEESEIDVLVRGEQGKLEP